MRPSNVICCAVFIAANTASELPACCAVSQKTTARVQSNQTARHFVVGFAAAALEPASVARGWGKGRSTHVQIVRISVPSGSPSGSLGGRSGMGGGVCAQGPASVV